MKVVGYYEAGSIDRSNALLNIEMPEPVLRERDILVRVRAVSVNQVDTKLRAGARPREGQATILGFDASGIVEAIGPEVTLFKVGDEVYYAGSIKRPGTYAELHAVDERIVGHKPLSLGWGEAAALPLTALTAWELLFDRLRIARRRDTPAGSILIVNGAGGVGSMLVQLARQQTNLTVIATASRPESIAWVENFGAHHVISHHQPLGEQLAEIGVSQVNYVASLSASESHLPTFAKIIAPQGSLALIDAPKSFDIVSLRDKSITVAWEGMFTRSNYQTDDMIAQHHVLEEVAHLIDEGIIRTTMTRELGPINAANLITAHRHLESGTAIGKTVLTGF